ncbi:unnamed protein product [Durusdinium trenchii]|uniref:Pseudouridine synthase RsuA/RluA-like domain-containing protein n=1 Tax=Durusdinium trenchii TaxID=1381693 RepID=A0ABP0MHG9_9DINO
MDMIGSYVVLRTQTFAEQGLANSVWGFGTLGIRNQLLLDAVAAAAMVGEFTSQGLTNTAWTYAALADRQVPLFSFVASTAPLAEMPFRELAMMAWSFATLQIHKEPFMNAVSSSAIPKLDTTVFRMCNMGPKEACPTEMVAALAGALQTLGMDTSEFFEAAASALARIAAPVDARNCGDSGVPLTDGGDEVPRVLATYPGIAFIYKPSGWSVAVSRETAGRLGDEDDSSDEEDPTFEEAPQLTSWLSSELAPWSPISGDPSAQHGIVHRLDLETSGPLLCATSYHGYMAALLLFAARKVTKEYVCVCKGWLSSQVDMLNSPLLYGEYQSMSRQGEGAHGMRDAKTQVLVVGHFLDPSNAPVSLVQVRLHTGRRHQIRAHLRYEGHPLVGDTTYGTGAEPWCGSLFLHSYHLGLSLGFPPFPACLLGAPEIWQRRRRQLCRPAGQRLPIPGRPGAHRPRQRGCCARRGRRKALRPTWHVSGEDPFHLVDLHPRAARRRPSRLWRRPDGRPGTGRDRRGSYRLQHVGGLWERRLSDLARNCPESIGLPATELSSV